jgi:CheY-like chemotaxis protein
MPFNITVEAGGVSRYKIMVDRGLLRQFFFSLALASSDQMKGGTGRIRINLSDRLPRQILSPDVERGSRICLRYSDGFIMPPELRDVFSAREYEPADVDRQFGTAYGTAYRASLEFGGWISFERGMGETILCLVLKGIASQGSTDSLSEAALTGENGVSVLLADDVDLVRETLGEFLRSQDFQVVTASGGDETMEELSRGVFDVIVLDLNMPGVPSIDIATHCLESFGRMAIILTSGYEKPEGIQALLAHDRVVFLPNPNPPGELVRLVNTLVTSMRRIRDDSPE